QVRYGSGGVGGALHIAVEMLRLKTGADFVHVPYRGGGQAASDAVAGQIEMVSLGLASARVAEGGALRVLAQTGPRRHPIRMCRPPPSLGCRTCAWIPGSACSPRPICPNRSSPAWCARATPW